MSGVSTSRPPLPWKHEVTGRRRRVDGATTQRGAAAPSATHHTFMKRTYPDLYRPRLPPPRVTQINPRHIHPQRDAALRERWCDYTVTHCLRDCLCTRTCESVCRCICICLCMLQRVNLTLQSDDSATVQYDAQMCQVRSYLFG